MPVLVIGGNRFFGRRLVRRLLDAGESVTVFNRGSRPLDSMKGDLRYEVGDRNDEEKLKRLIRSQTWDLVFDQVCFEAPQARALVRTCTDVGKLIFTSTQAVYPSGRLKAKEDLFDPLSYRFSVDAKTKTKYDQAKKQCEAIFHQTAPCKVVSVRLPIVLGKDDYTERLKWHVTQVQASRAIFFPSLDSRISFIDSEDAAQALQFVASTNHIGPINASAPDDVSVGELIAMIEAKVKKKALFTNQSGREDSVFHWRNMTMDVSLISELGFCPSPLTSWLPQLIDEFASDSNK